MQKIVFVSRLDEDCSLGAHVLCDIAPRLANKFDNLQIFIIGGGAELKKISQKAEKVNRDVNRQLIFITGTVNNPSVYFDQNTLFVGVSRSALEAMAQKLPVILLGNEGYLGLLNENNLDFAQKTNFTCRGAGKTDNTEALSPDLFDEICHYFSLSKEEKERISEFSYNIIKNGYTARSMAKKTVEIYQKALENNKKLRYKNSCAHPKIVICGYYGRGNLGDEAILLVIRQKLRTLTPNAKICVIKSKNLFKNALSLLGANLFIFGGGSLLQNSTSNASLLYYLATIHTANLMCKHKIMLSNGVGPIESRLISRKTLLKMIARAVNTFDVISVRDTFSKQLLSEILPNRKINLIPDPALAHARKINRESIKEAKKEYLIYIPCGGGLKRGGISINELIKTLNEVQKQQGTPLLIAVLNPREDLSLAKVLADHLKDTKVKTPRTPKELFSLLGSAKFVISQRYHGTLFASGCQIPTLAVSNDTKMYALCKDFLLFPCQNVNILASPYKLSQKISSAIKNHEQNCNQKIIALEQNFHISDCLLEKLLMNFDNLY